MTPVLQRHLGFRGQRRNLPRPPNDGPFYWERTLYNRLDKIKVPVYTGGPWGAWWPEGAFNVYQGVNTPKKILIGPGGDERPWYQNHDEALRWFDHWLKGIDNGILDEPPIKLFVLGVNEWHYEHEWPLARTKWTKFYLRSRGRLMEEAPIFNEGPDCFVQQPLDETSVINSIKYSTESLNGDVELTGPMAFYLYASIDQDDTNWQVKLYDADEYGISKRMLTANWLKASHRAVDKSKSEPWHPWHPHTHREPVSPGKVYEYAIGLPPKSYLFRASHRIELEIASMDDVPGGLHICSSKTTLHKVYHNPDYPSYVLLPVIPNE